MRIYFKEAFLITVWWHLWRHADTSEYNILRLHCVAYLTAVLRA